MTAANGIKSETNGATALMRRCAANVITALTMLVRPARIHPKLPWLPERQQLAIAAGIFAAVLLIVMIFIDAAAINAVAHLPRWLISVFDWLTDFGKSGWFLWPLGILFLALAALPQGLTRVSQHVVAVMMVRVGFLFVAIGVPSLFVTIVKRFIGRGRPLVTGVADPFVFDPFKWSAAYAGLPSGHTTTAFAALVAFGSLWPRARSTVLIYALVIAASRVIVTAHYPSDVLAGVVVGTVGALMVRRWFALRHLGFSVGPDGVLHQNPGPSLKRIKSVARELLAQ